MSPEIYARSADEVHRYRVTKAVVAVPLMVVAMYISSQQKPADVPLPQVRARPITRIPVVTTDEAMREDFPVRWGQAGKGKLKRVGKHSLFGTGPKNAQVYLYEGESLLTRSRTNGEGRWKAQIHIKEPGVKTYRADFRRGGIAAGRSLPLSITLVDPSKRDASDVSITNLAPNDRVIAGYFTLRGSAPPGDFVQIYVDSTFLGRAEVDLAGRWSFKPKINAGGRRTFTVIDEITERQFGPLAVYIVGKKAAPKPKVANSAQGVPLR